VNRAVGNGEMSVGVGITTWAECCSGRTVRAAPEIQATTAKNIKD
jgi:hypothetical protein